MRTFATSDGLELEVFHALSELASSGPREEPSPGHADPAADVAAFTGRDTELQQLIAAAGSAGVVAIHTVGGMPGIGKTALVTRAAHLLKNAFPDGQLFVRLHAHTPGREPVAPGTRWPGC